MGQSESSPSAGATPNRKDRIVDGSPGSRRGTSWAQNSPSTSSHLSATTSNPTPPSSTTDPTTLRPRSATTASAPVTMGNSESKQQRPPSRSSTLQTPPQPAEQRQPSPLSQAVDIPTPSSHDAASELDDIVPITSPFGLPAASTFTNPPRLPLPIDGDPEPSSPIFGPQETPPLATSEDTYGTGLPKRASLVSSSTLDEDEGADIQQFATETDPLAPKVPTNITYREGGRHVYVTGTFASWEKKFRMQRGKDGVFHVTIPLAPGTHHLIFLVDGDPKTSMEIPTTVDFANALVNYIEVLAPDAMEGEKRAAQAMPIPGAVARDGGSMPLADDQPIPTALGATGDELSDIKGTASPIPDQPPSSLRPHSLPRHSLPPDEADTYSQSQRARQRQKLPLKKALPRPKYTSEIPLILAHLDFYNTPNDSRYRLATKACQHLPQPPSLPMFMSKSILNATTPQKDDASVLTMPNHTILNHLATSSIRQGVLATSGTTRYKRKFLTTIMYKPTADSG